MLLGAVALACLLCVTYTAFAQDLTSTPFANLTLIQQNDANFSSNVALPSFPCDGAGKGLSGGYSSLDPEDIDTYYVSQFVLRYFLVATANLTDCEVLLDNIFNISEACSQVRPSFVLCKENRLPLLLHNTLVRSVCTWQEASVERLTHNLILVAGCGGHKLCCRA